jgi:hypothetical protein
MPDEDGAFRAKVVYLILSRETEQALCMLSRHYKIVEPKTKVGMPKRHSRNAACYVAKTKTIHVSHREILFNPPVILHEFYHHLRSVSDAQGGIEKYANKFAAKYMKTY